MGESRAVRMKPFSLLVIWLEVVIKYISSLIYQVLFMHQVFICTCYRMAAKRIKPCVCILTQEQQFLK